MSVFQVAKRRPTSSDRRVADSCQSQRGRRRERRARGPYTALEYCGGCRKAQWCQGGGTIVTLLLIVLVTEIDFFKRADQLTLGHSGALGRASGRIYKDRGGNALEDVDDG